MEEFKSRNNNFDTDKFMGQFLVSPLLTNMKFDTSKIKHKIENIDNPNNIYNSYIRCQLNLNLNEYNGIFGSQKGEEFLLDSFLSPKNEDQNQTEISNNTKSSTCFDPNYENQIKLNMNENDRKLIN